jgi:hypothetical protein
MYYNEATLHLDLALIKARNNGTFFEFELEIIDIVKQYSEYDVLYANKKELDGYYHNYSKDLHILLNKYLPTISYWFDSTELDLVYSKKIKTGKELLEFVKKIEKLFNDFVIINFMPCSLSTKNKYLKHTGVM